MNLENSLTHGLQWSLALLAVAAAWGALFYARRLVLARLERHARASASVIDDCLVEAISETRPLLWLPLILTLVGPVLALPARAMSAIEYATFIGLLLQIGLWLNRLIVVWLQRMLSRWDAAKATTMSMLGWCLRVAVWSILVFTALDTLGFDITALVAGLGIGGVAVALAAQAVLGDLLASLSIVFDKPFLRGDFIVIDDKMGTVENIGIKTTRLRSLSGEQLIFSNSDLLQSRIRNFKRMRERRVEFRIGVTYHTPAEQLERIPQVIREIVESQQATRFDRAHFKDFGDSALVFETVYFVLSADYNTYMDVHQAVSIALVRRFERQGIEFAYPTQTLYLRRAAA
jgi:small-conductance mechanosensitive channel